MTTSDDGKTVAIPKRALRGSRLRFLMLTSAPEEQIAETLTRLVSPLASVDPSHDRWMPIGFLHPKEARLGECEKFLRPEIRSKLTQWWLKVPERANTPNWDLVSTCTVEGKQGIILVEGKAHAGELKRDGKPQGNAENDEQIELAIKEATMGLEQIIPGWNLCRDSHYQLCNRFAWAWKIATLGVPTILVYLGFLHATEMQDQGKPFDSPEEWNRTVLEHTSTGLANGACVVPKLAWESQIQTSGAPLWAVIRSLDQRWCVGG